MPAKTLFHLDGHPVCRGNRLWCGCIDRWVTVLRIEEDYEVFFEPDPIPDMGHFVGARGGFAPINAFSWSRK